MARRMPGESEPTRGLGPYNVREVAVGLLALGIAGIFWGLFTMYEFQVPALLPLIGGVVLFVVGLVVWRWNLARRA